MSVEREPVRRKKHPAADLPERPVRAGLVGETLPPQTLQTASAAPTDVAEKLVEQFNVRIKPSTKIRLGQAVDKLRYTTGDRSISLASVTDKAINEYLDRELG